MVVFSRKAREHGGCQRLERRIQHIEDDTRYANAVAEQPEAYPIDCCWRKSIPVALRQFLLIFISANKAIIGIWLVEIKSFFTICL